MPVIYYIIALVALIITIVVYRIGYHNGKKAKRLVIESLSFKQAMKLWQIHELLRHENDKRMIRKDLKKLADVEMPPGIDYEAWFDVK